MSYVQRSRNYDLGKRADDVQATRTRIAVAAMELHASLGPARTTLSAVAERAGVRRNTLYRHFPTEEDLNDACSGHFWSLHPLPDPARWRQVEEPQCRFETALSAVYAYYGETTEMMANLIRDAEVLPVVARSLEDYRALLDDIAQIAGEGQPARATARHALEFATWRSLVVHGGLTDDVAVELMSALAFGTAGREHTGEPATAPQQGKREAVVCAAFAAFAEHGFRVSLDEIAERAGVSKVTIYSYFTSKEALFRTVITEQLDEAVSAARQLRSTGPADLRELCAACVDVLTSPAMANLHSVLEAEAKRFPDDTAAWLGRVPTELRLVLEDALRAVPSIPDPELAVTQLYALCVQPGEPAVIDSGVAMFLKYYGS